MLAIIVDPRDPTVPTEWEADALDAQERMNGEAPVDRLPVAGVFPESAFNSFG